MSSIRHKRQSNRRLKQHDAHVHFDVGKDAARHHQRVHREEVSFLNTDSPSSIIAKTNNNNGGQTRGFDHHRPLSSVMMDRNLYAPKDASSAYTSTIQHPIRDKDRQRRRQNRANSKTRRDVYDLDEMMAQMMLHVSPHVLAANTKESWKLAYKLCKIQQYERINKHMAAHIAGTRMASSSIDAANQAASPSAMYSARDEKMYMVGARGARFYMSASGKRQYYRRHSSHHRHSRTKRR